MCPIKAFSVLFDVRSIWIPEDSHSPYYNPFFFSISKYFHLPNSHRKYDLRPIYLSAICLFFLTTTFTLSGGFSHKHWNLEKIYLNSSVITKILRNSLRFLRNSPPVRICNRSVFWARKGNKQCWDFLKAFPLREWDEHPGANRQKKSQLFHAWWDKRFYFYIFGGESGDGVTKIN